MKYFYDTEFVDDGKTIEFLSIGIVAEDGREYYAITDKHGAIHRACNHRWLRDNVVRYLPVKLIDPSVGNGEYGWFWKTEHADMKYVKPREQIAREIRDFILSDAQPELWAYFAAYDHVVLSQLFGRMLDLPVGMPMWSHDLCQEIERHQGAYIEPQSEGAHNALADARWNKETYEALNSSLQASQGVLRALELRG